MAFRLWQTGIHIQQEQVVIIALERVRNRWSLRRWWCIPLASGIVRQGQIMEPQGLADALRDWRRELPIQHRVHIAFPVGRTLQKTLPRPALRLRESEQAEWIAGSMAQSLDMDPDALCFDYCERDQDNLYSITAARNHDIAVLTGLTKTLRLQLAAITPDACALQQFLPWLSAEERCLAWQDDERWLWATQTGWGSGALSETPCVARLASSLGYQERELVQCTARSIPSPHFDPWCALSFQQPPLPASGDAFAIALGLALGGKSA